MRGYSEYRKDFNNEKMRSGEKIFLRRLRGLEGENITVNRSNTTVRGLIINEENINSDSKEFRTLCVEKDVLIKHGDEIIYNDEYYLVITDIDYHYYYKSCKIKKCNNVLKWKYYGKIYEFPCILSNDSYGVKVLSDNDYIRTQNIKSQIIVQDNAITRKIIPDMRFIFNHSEFDIYNIIDINRSMTRGVITFTSEKSILQVEDNLKDNIAFSKVLYDEENELDKTPILPSTYTINGVNEFNQETKSTFTLNPLRDCVFYIDDFDTENIANIISDDGKGTCIIYGKPNRSNNWFVLYAKDLEGNELITKEITVLKV